MTDISKEDINTIEWRLYHHYGNTVDRDHLALAKIRVQAAEIEQLRNLDAEYGRVEAAIIAADPEFDGDSDHADCGRRLIASVERLTARVSELEVNLAKAEVVVRIISSDKWEERLGEAVDLSCEYLAELEGQDDE